MRHEPNFTSHQHFDVRFFRMGERIGKADTRVGEGSRRRLSSRSNAGKVGLQHEGTQPVQGTSRPITGSPAEAFAEIAQTCDKPPATSLAKAYRIRLSRDRSEVCSNVVYATTAIAVLLWLVAIVV